MTIRKSMVMFGLILAGIGAYAKSSVVQIKGSDTILNASQAIVEEYMKTNKKARIAVTGGGSGVGIASLINNTADIAMASRNIKSSEVEALEKKGIKVDEIVLGKMLIQKLWQEFSQEKLQTGKNLEETTLK